MALIFHLSGIFVFRNIIPFIPEILNGDSVINGDELVPFFNWHTQLLDQAAGKFNDITHGYEFRVRYAFLTTWFRYFKILPFAIIFMIPQIFWWAYLVVSWVLSRVLTQFKPTTIYKITAGPVAVVFMIMIYAKITHFYTLVLGFALFLVAAMCMLYGLVFPMKNPIKPIVVACLLTVFNPAVHYLVLFGLYMAFTVGTLVLIELVPVLLHGGLRYVARPKTWLRGLRYLLKNWRELFISNRFFRCVGACILFVLVTLIPYVLMVQLVFLRGVSNLSETVPADYYFIKDASIPLPHVLSFEMAGIMDKEATGDYLVKDPRLANLVYTALLFVPLLLPSARRQIFNSPALRRFGTVLYVNTIFAMWATLGYSGADWLPTFHRVLAVVSNFAEGTQSLPGDLVVKLCSTITQVLRFPHRFELIMFMMACAIMPISVIWLESVIARKWRELRVSREREGKRTPLSSWARRLPVVMGLLAAMPLLSNDSYRNTFASGDYNHFLRPYPLGPLREVKRVLLNLPRGITVVFPPTETAKDVVDSEGYEHKFIDKFHSYYLDLPSYYYGLTGDSNNKHNFFLLFRALYYEQPWWINIARNLNIRYIVVNKELTANTVGGQEYLRDIERIIIPEMDRRKDFVRKLFENESYVLYEFTDLPTAKRVPLWISTDWSTYIQILSRNLELTRYYELRHTMMAGDLDSFDHLTLVTNDEHQSALDLYIKANPTVYAKPGNALAFNPNLISSAYYLSPMFRLFQFFSDSKWNRLNMITPGLWGTLDGSFMGVPRPTTVRVDIKLPEAGTYRLVMRGAASWNELRVTSKVLPEPQAITLHARTDHLAFYDKATVFTSSRKPLDVEQYTVSELGNMVPSDVVAINSQYDYFDFGTVTGNAGKYTLYIQKLDSNPLLIEGIAAIPADTYDNLKLPDNVQVVTESQLCCRSFVYDGRTP